MTREFFTPQRNRWIAPSIHLAERLDVTIEFLLPGRLQILVVGQTILRRSEKGMKANRRVGK